MSFHNYIFTLKDLKISQIYYRILKKIRIKKVKKIGRLPKTNEINLFIEDLHFDSKYINRFRINNSKIVILNKECDFNYSNSYLKTLKPLNRFNLEYFEYAIFLAYLYKSQNNKKYFEIFKESYLNYINSNTTPSSYVYSLQIINILIAKELFKECIDDEFENIIEKQLYKEYLFILKNKEKDLLANHYLENLFTIVISSFYFNNIKKCKKYLKKLKVELDKQILKDGMHFELSPMYHKKIMEDLILVLELSKNNNFPSQEWIRKTLYKMFDAIYSLEYKTNRTPLFNDSGDNVAKDLNELSNVCIKKYKMYPHLKESLNDSGYYKLYDNSISLIFDVGKIGPKYNPGHGHCDCLSYELFYDNNPMLVNSGTYCYQGDERNYFRSTSAHNTFMIENYEQSEIWGEHRVAKKIQNIKAIRSGNKVIGQYESSHKDVFIREISLNDNLLNIEDSTITNKKGLVHSYLRLAPEYYLKGQDIYLNNEIVANFNCKSCDYKINNNEYYSDKIGYLKKINCIDFFWNIDNKKHGYSIVFIKGEKND